MAAGLKMWRVLGVCAAAVAGLSLIAAGRAEAEAEAATGRYTVNAETVLDNGTGLEWQRAEGPARSFKQADDYCTNLTLANRSGWSVPDIRQLETLVDDSRVEPAIDLTAFPGATANNFWTSTQRASDRNWAVNFRTGESNDPLVSLLLPVRCVHSR